MAKRTLLDIAADYERRAQALRLAHAELTGAGIAAAQVALPKTLKAAARLRANANHDGNHDGAKPPHERGGIVRRVLAALAAHGAMTHGEIAKEIAPYTPSGTLTNLTKRGVVTATTTPKGFRYALTNTGRAKVKANGDTPKPSRKTNGKAKREQDRNDDPPTALRGPKLTAFLLRAVDDKPRTLADLVVALQAVDHPITSMNGIAGPMGKIASTGLLRRNGKGIYHVTPKGSRRLKALEDKAANHAPDRATADDAAS